MELHEPDTKKYLVHETGLYNDEMLSCLLAVRSDRSAKKEELSYDEDEEWERGTERIDVDDVEIKGQKLTEIFMVI